MKVDIIHQVERHGYAVRIIPVSHVRDLQENLETNRSNGLFDEEFFTRYFGSFDFKPPEEARSIITMAIRQSPVRFIFTFAGKPVQVTVPATYLHADEVDRKAQESLTEVLAGAGYKVTPVKLPKKLLAVHSGLATYGRNNITYVEGMGSYHRLAAFYSDMPCEETDSWQELKMLDRCKNCRICLKQCPADAITTERFLIHAEKCIVFHNEKSTEVPFPSWIEKSWHNCLVGCMLCQESCPENKEYTGLINKGVEFTTVETDSLLTGIPQEQMSATLVKKLEETDLLNLLEVIPRNLKVLLE